MENNPLVTINILSFNRKDELRNTLTKVYGQDYKNIEVIVVDNASSDGSPEMVVKEFPIVRLIELEKNIGIAGWNEGFKVAQGEYVLVLDDDSYPNEKAIYEGVKVIRKNTIIGVIAFRIWNERMKLYENSEFSTNVLPHFVGCGALIRKKVIEKVGYFYDTLFLYEHEREYTLRLYNEGFIIKYVDNPLIIHNSSYLNRTDKRKKFYFTRNFLIILFIHFEFRKVVFRMIRISIGRLLSGLKQGGFLSIVKGIASFILLLPNLIKNRKILQDEIQKKFNYGNFAGGFHFKQNDWYN